MASYAEAEAAIRTRLEANWTATRVAYPNEEPDPPWPPIDPATGSSAPWAALEVIGTGSHGYAAGKPGNQLWLYTGLIHVHVFVPIGTGATLAKQYAGAIGEIFRNTKFYEPGNGSWARGLAPSTDGDGDKADGNTWRVTMTCPFEYFHRG